jgi:toxin ParE1/3/4
MILVFHPLAQRELVAATKFYETQSSGLGTDFMRQVEATLAHVLANPELGSLFSGDKIRRRLVARFPTAWFTN